MSAQGNSQHTISCESFHYDESNVDFLLLKARSDFSAWAVREGYQFALAMLGEANIIIDPKMDYPAGISNRDGIKIYIHPKILGLYQYKPECFYFILIHELRHLVQIADFAATKELINANPLDIVFRKKYESLRALGIPLPQPTEQSMNALKFKIWNVAADAALHEDLIRSFGIEVLNTINAFLKTTFLKDGNPEDCGLVTVDSLIEYTGRKLERDKDWLYYANEYVLHLAKEVEEDEDGNFIAIAQDLTMVESLSGTGGDSHDLDPDKVDEIERSAGKAQNEAKKLQTPPRKLKNKNEDRRAGLGIGDDWAEIEAKARLNSRIKRAVDLVKRKIRTVVKQTDERPIDYSYAILNKILPDLPGRRRTEVKIKKRCRVRVLVLDTSGSMWIEEFLQQMVALARQLSDCKYLHAMYCCDTKLHRIDFTDSGSLRVKGGGGTEFSRTHNSLVLEDLGVEEGVEIFYLTDGYVFGLDSAKKDERVVLHEINIPNLLRKETEDEDEEENKSDTMESHSGW